MSGYFDKLQQSYGAQLTRPVFDLRWTPESEKAPALAEVAPQFGTPSPIETKSPEQVTKLQVETPTRDQLPPIDSGVYPPRALEPEEPEHTGDEKIVPPSERIIERISELPVEASLPLQNDDAEPSLVEVNKTELIEMHHHNHVYVEGTGAPEGQVHSEVPEVIAPQPSPESEQTPPELNSDRDALAGLETHLADVLSRLHGEQTVQPDVRIEPVDFELDERTLQLVPEIETIREVTRETVKEVHHHHHHETRIEASRPPAPRSAQEASQIGRIRFASSGLSRGGE